MPLDMGERSKKNISRAKELKTTEKCSNQPPPPPPPRPEGFFTLSSASRHQGFHELYSHEADNTSHTLYKKKSHKKHLLFPIHTQQQQPAAAL